MTEHANQLIEILNSRLSHIVGFFSAAAASVSANVQSNVGVMEFVWVRLPSAQGLVIINTQDVITLTGGITALVIGVATAIKLFSQK